MSSRVTRSSARAANESSPSSTGGTASQPDQAVNTANHPQTHQPPPSKKRKIATPTAEKKRSTKLEGSADDTPSPPRSRSKRVKLGGKATPVTPQGRKQDLEGDISMANNRSPPSGMDEANSKGKGTSRPPTGKRHSSKGKQNTDDSAATSRPISRSRKGRRHQTFDDFESKGPSEAKPDPSEKETSKSPPAPPRQPTPPEPARHPTSLEESDNDDPFSANFLRRHGGLAHTIRAMSGMLSGTMAKTRAILDKLKQRDDPSMQLIALSELSELLLVSTEDNLAGMSPDAFVRELVRLMQPDDFGFDNPEIQLLACRCLANMMEALPSSTAAIAYGGAVPILCQKLLAIDFIDLAEQALSTLEKVSHDFPGQIVREGGLTACLTYLDFFATSTQRTAVTTAANCCRNLGQDSFPVVRDAMPILLNVMNNSDQKVLEQGCLCVSRIVESYKYATKKVEELIDRDMLQAILRLLLPGSTNLIGTGIQTQFLRVLSLVARSSPQRALELLQMNVVDTLYQILTGVSPPSDMSEINSRAQKVIVMQALIHRPRDQVLEALNVMSEVLPGIPPHLALQSQPSSQVILPYRPEVMRAELSRQLPQDQNYESRQQILAGAKQELKHFTIVLLPTLVDAYSSTVNFSVRQKVLTAQLKILSNVDAEIVAEALSSVDYCSFLAAILSQHDHPLLVTYALQAAGLLMQRLESTYLYQFHREGVIAEVENLASRPLPEENDEPTTESGAPVSQPGVIPPPPPITEAKPEAEAPPPTASNEDAQEDEDDDQDENDDDAEDDEDEDDHDEELDLDIEMQEDTESDSEEEYTGRPPMTADQVASKQTASTEAEITRLAKNLLASLQQSGSNDQAHQRLQELTALTTELQAHAQRDSSEIPQLFEKLAGYFHQDTRASMTSFELMRCKVVDVLLEVLSSGSPGSQSVHAAFAEAFMTPISTSTSAKDDGSAPTAFGILVHQLQDVLARAEHYEVITVHQGGVDSAPSSAASMLAKQIKLKLVATEEEGIPKPFRRFMVSIHAIANFKALEEFLRQRIALAERPRIPSVSRARESLLQAMQEARRLGLMDDAPFGALAGMPTPPAASRPSTGSTSQKPEVTAADTAKPEEQSTPQNKPSNSRKSSRLVKKSRPDGADTQPTPQPSAEERLECADEAQLSDPEVDYDAALDALMEDIDHGISDEDDGEEPSPVNMEVASGGKVVARKEDGTRVATPIHQQKSEDKLSTPLASVAKPAASPSAPQPSRAMSYAAAVQATPQDWHLEFSVNGQIITNDTTVYRAVHFNDSANRDLSARNIWGAVHEISFRQVQGPPTGESFRARQSTPSSESGDLPQSLKENPITSGVLRLLGLLYNLNSHIKDLLPAASGRQTTSSGESSAQFVNTKLTAKLNRQLEEPLIVASDCLPTWSEDLARLYPFLFPFETRFLFLQSTSFGYSRSMNRWQGASQTANRNSRSRDDRPYLGKPQRQKVRISRHDIMKAAIKVMELYGSSPAILEVEYFEEVGTGLGPTLEFYSTVSKEFAKKKLRMWRDGSDTGSEYAAGQQGLFPAPMTESQAQSETGKRILALFATMGKFVARSLIDSRIIDINFNPTFFELSLAGSSAVPTQALLRRIDPALADSLAYLQKFADAKRLIEEDASIPDAEKSQKIEAIRINDATPTDLHLDFTYPGHPSISLLSTSDSGASTPVTIHNIQQFITLVTAMTLTTGVTHQFQAFRSGFSEVFPFPALKAFTPDELVMLFGQSEEDWSMETLMDAVKADHGFNLDSKSVRNLLQIMSGYDVQERREFLQFVTGSPKLPIGGFKSLTPMFTIVCKPAESPLTSDDYLPSVMTCVNYLKLPDYSGLEVMRGKLGVAVREGQGAFHLS